MQPATNIKYNQKRASSKEIKEKNIKYKFTRMLLEKNNTR